MLKCHKSFFVKTKGEKVETREQKIKTFVWLTVFVVVFWILVFMGILGVFSYAFAYMPAAPASVQLPEFKNYQSKKLEIGFDYPKILKVWEKE